MPLKFHIATIVFVKYIYTYIYIAISIYRIKGLLLEIYGIITVYHLDGLYLSTTNLFLYDGINELQLLVTCYILTYS